MITRINELRILTRHISSKCECKFECCIKCEIKKCRCGCKNPKEHRRCEKSYFWNPAKGICKNRKYAEDIGDLEVMCDEIIGETKTISTKISSTKFTSTKTVRKNSASITCSLYILLAVLLITIALLIAVSI